MIETRSQADSRTQSDTESDANEAIRITAFVARGSRLFFMQQRQKGYYSKQHTRHEQMRLLYKRRSQRQHAQALRIAQRSTSAAPFSRSMGQLASGIQSWAKQHSVALAMTAAALLFLFYGMSIASGVAAFGSQTMLPMFVTSYTAEDIAIHDSALLYSFLEAELDEHLRHIPETMPGYDEYRYALDDIGHDPFALLSYLTARYENFSFSTVEAEIRNLFAMQYTLSTQVIIEIRYRTEYYSYVGPNGTVSGSRQVPYNYVILETTLLTKPLEAVLSDRLTAEQQERYAALQDTLGLRQFYGSPLSSLWRSQISSSYGYREHPFAGGISLHRGLDIAAATGTPITAIHDATVIAVQPHDSGDFGRYLILEDKHGLRSVYAHCERILVASGQKVSRGEHIADVGNSGLSTGSHLHLELLRNGSYLNPLFHLQGYR